MMQRCYRWIAVSPLRTLDMDDARTLQMRVDHEVLDFGENRQVSAKVGIIGLVYESTVSSRLRLSTRKCC